MAAINPNYGRVAHPIVTERQSDILPTAVTDGDTLTIGHLTTLTQAKCFLERVDNGADVVFTTATNVVTIGVNAPPLASTQIKGFVTGV